MSVSTQTIDLESTRQFYERIQQFFDMYERNASSTGELFNVFKVLKLGGDEVRLHTSLIGELINPKGSHRQGTTFLKAFLEVLGVSDIDPETCAIEIEKHIGAVNADRTEGGRIDINIKDANGREVIIENKIFAADQQNQLWRYHKYNTKASLFYLTLDGRNPLETSTGGLDLNKDQLISYGSHILRWLRACRKEATSLPTVRETISQYMSLIRHLTHQPESEAMNQEIRKLIIENAHLLPSIEAYASELEAMRGDVESEFDKLMDEHLPAGVVTKFKDAEIVFEWGEDGDGVYYGYKLMRDGKKVNDMPERERLTQELCAIRDGFHPNSEFLGWRNPPQFLRYQRFHQIPAERIVQYYSDHKKLEKLVQEIMDEEKDIRSAFLERIKKY